MGTVWEGYYKGVPLLEVPENPIDQMAVFPLSFVSFPGCKTVGVLFQSVEIPGLPGEPMNKNQDEWEWRRPIDPFQV